MLEYFPYVVVPDDLKLQELKTLAKKWNKIAQNAPAYKKRSSDSLITHNSEESSGTLDLTPPNTNLVQPASKRQKPAPQPRRTKTKSVRPQKVAQLSKGGPSALPRRSRKSRTTQSNTTKLIDNESDENHQTSDLQAESFPKPYNRPRRKSSQKLESLSSSLDKTPHQPVNLIDSTRSHKKTFKYSSSLTALSDDEHCLSPLVETSSPEPPPSHHKYLSESTLVDLGELEGIVFEAQQKPSLTPSRSTPHESSWANSTTLPPVTDEEINLIYLGGENFFQPLDKEEEANLPAPHFSSEKGPCKCGCHEEMVLLKEQIQKLEDLVFPEFRAIPPCCAAVIAELP